mmetsp:Transcript_15971/g.50171  ORF Transcript_15971/g.50171 Transcript_15971/m.50171 type:complete len:493 (-) Transcript_15971:147-1625(-)
MRRGHHRGLLLREGHGPQFVHEALEPCEGIGTVVPVRPAVLEVRQHHGGVVAARAVPGVRGVRDDGRVVHEQLEEGRVRLLDAALHAAEGGELEPRLEVLAHGHHQAAHAQQRLPHLDVALRPAQPLPPDVAQELPLLLGWHEVRPLPGEAVLDHLLDLAQLLHPHHLRVGALVRLPHERRQLRPEQLPREVDELARLAVLALVHAQDRAVEGGGGPARDRGRLAAQRARHVIDPSPPQPVESGHVPLQPPVGVLERRHILLHLLPLPHLPRGLRGEGREAPPHVEIALAIQVARQHAQLLPLRQRSEAAHLPERGLESLHARGAGRRGLALVGIERLLPALQLLVPALLELHLELLLRVREHAHRRLGLPQLVVDGDECLHRRVGGRKELHLLVVQRLCEGVALLCEGAQGADVHGQRLLVVLHELREVQESCQDLGGDRGRREGRLEGAHELLLVPLVQFRPARDEARGEEVARHVRLQLREAAARAQGV